ncbi:polysaccharide biosynthesis protein [Actinomadura yumaensis]|uniref:polysaccharide biosynthesis protein n=1 Tax=Actinomadura yumaensis TaxID=111807 RepID=UPI00361B0155
MRWLPRRRAPRRAPAPDPAPASPLALLMGRDEVALAGRRGRRLVRGRRVLVTGACGTVGSALCHRVRRLEPAALCLVDKDAGRLARLGGELAGLLDAELVTLAAADVRDAAAVDGVVRAARPDLVFHTAAVNELAAVERDPCRGVADNVLGTRHVVDSAVRHDVERLVLASSDKAADPTSVFGATMRLGELLLQTATGGRTCFAAVRVGNVIGEPGPLLSVLAHRISSGEAVTITHPEVARHFMTVEEAAGLLLEAAALAEEAETFVLDMGSPVPVIELVHRYAEQLRLPEVTIRFSGLGPGEKLAEKTFADSERRIRTAHPKIWGTRPAPPPPGCRSSWTGCRPPRTPETPSGCGCCCGGCCPSTGPSAAPSRPATRRPARRRCATPDAAPNRPACEVLMSPSRKLRVATVITRFNGGAGQVALNGALALPPAGYERAVITGGVGIDSRTASGGGSGGSGGSGGGPSRADVLHGEEAVANAAAGDLTLLAHEAGMEIVQVRPLVPQISPRDDLAALRALTRVLAEGRYDVVHTHSAKGGVIGRVAAARAGVPRIVHTWHGFPFNEFQSWPRRRAYIGLERIAAKHTDAFLAIGSETVTTALRLGLASPNGSGCRGPPWTSPRTRPRPGPARRRAAASTCRSA